MSVLGAWREVDELLRTQGVHAPRRASVPWRRLALVLVCAGPIYGAIMGAWNGRLLQAFYSATKVPMLLTGALLVCLPNFFVMNTVLGLRDDFSAALRGVLSTQAVVAVVLASVAPLTGFAYFCGVPYGTAMVMNGLAFLAASLGGQVALTRHYRPLIHRNPRHRLTLAAWLILYWFVAVQLAWMLRPFVGAAGLEPTFLRSSAWGNAYVRVFEAILEAFGGK